MKKIYIAGKVTGLVDYKARFEAESRRLRTLGYRPVNPTEIIDEGEPWESAMKTALRAMLECDGVSLLPDWMNSRGARMEYWLATELGMDVRRTEGWTA